MKWFNPVKGFGFICVEGTGEDIFVHAHDVHGNPLRDHDDVDFDIEDDDRKNGRKRCANVTGGTGRRKKAKKPKEKIEKDEESLSNEEESLSEGEKTFRRGRRAFRRALLLGMNFSSSSESDSESVSQTGI